MDDDTLQQQWASTAADLISILLKLPSDTRIYAGHEFYGTAEEVEWYLHKDNENKWILKKV